jgi:hypothetical protein
VVAGVVGVVGVVVVWVGVVGVVAGVVVVGVEVVGAGVVWVLVVVTGWHCPTDRLFTWLASETIAPRRLPLTVAGRLATCAARPRVALRTVLQSPALSAEEIRFSSFCSPLAWSPVSSPEPLPPQPATNATAKPRLPARSAR